MQTHEISYSSANIIGKECNICLFIIGDADRVREKIERNLLEEKLDEAGIFSSNLSSAILRLVGEVESSFRASTILAGGDDVYFKLPKTTYCRSKLVSIGERFTAGSGCTISFGVGPTIKDAYINLRRAKSRGGSRIVDHEIDQ